MEVGTMINRKMLSTIAHFGFGKPLNFVKCHTPVLYMLDYRVIIAQGWYWKRSHQDTFLRTWSGPVYWGGDAWN